MDRFFHFLQEHRDAIVFLLSLSIIIGILPWLRLNLSQQHKNKPAQKPNINPENLSTSAEWCNRGHELRRQEKYREAILSYDRAIALDANYYQAWCGRGMALEAIEDYENALSDYDRALSIERNDRTAKLNRDNLLWKTGSADKVIDRQDKHKRQHTTILDIYNDAFELDPDNYQTWLKRGTILFNLGQLEDALMCYDLALELKPNNLLLWRIRGTTLRELSRYEEAILNYDTALTYNPEYHLFWHERSICLLQLKRYTEAIKNLDKVLELNPKSADAFYNKACCYALEGNLDLAIENLKRAIDLHPEKCIELAKEDPDFNNIRDEPHFQKAIGGI